MNTTPERRVVITGMGVVSPLGNSLDELWDSLESHRSGIRPIERIPTDYLPAVCGGEARGFTGNISDFGPLSGDQKRTIRKGLKVMCREIQMGVAAAQLAITNAGIDDPQPDRTGVVFGSDHITTTPDEFVEGINGCGADRDVFDYESWPELGMPRVTPLWMLKYLPNMPASHVAIYNDFRGPNNSLIYREASANLCLGEACSTITRGSADRMVAGATGCYIHPLKSVHLAMQMQLARNGSRAENICRPFDRGRTGMVLGEGAGALFLEEREMALKRGASIHGEIVGHGSSIRVLPSGAADVPVALENSIRVSLRMADLDSSQLGHVHAHGLGTRRADEDEAAALNAVFGGTSSMPPVTAAKSYFGCLGAGGGAVELICSLLAFRKQRLFPVLNYETPDPNCPVSLVTGDDQPPGDSVLNVSFTPQGQASCVLVRV